MLTDDSDGSDCRDPDCSDNDLRRVTHVRTPEAKGHKRVGIRQRVVKIGQTVTEGEKRVLCRDYPVLTNDAVPFCSTVIRYPS